MYPLKYPHAKSTKETFIGSIQFFAFSVYKTLLQSSQMALFFKVSTQAKPLEFFAGLFLLRDNCSG